MIHTGTRIYIYIGKSTCVSAHGAILFSERARAIAVIHMRAYTCVNTRLVYSEKVREKEIAKKESKTERGRARERWSTRVSIGTLPACDIPLKPVV